MKTLMTVFLATLLLTGAMACSKLGIGNPKSGKSTLTAKVDGKDYSANEVEGVMGRGLDGKVYIGIDGDYTRTGWQRIHLSFKEEQGTGTFAFTKESPTSGTPHIASYQIEDDNGIPAIGSAVSGALTITEFDKAKKMVKGTFSFTTEAFYPIAKVSVTEGKFEIYYIEIL